MFDNIKLVSYTIIVNKNELYNYIVFQEKRVNHWYINILLYLYYQNIIKL